MNNETAMTNGARWQDGIDRRLDQNTEAINVLALRMQQQVDRLDAALQGQNDFRTEMKSLRGKVDDQARFLDRLRWGLGIAAAALMTAWGLTTKWVEKQLGL